MDSVSGAVLDLAYVHYAVSHPDPQRRRDARQYLRDRGGLTPGGRAYYMVLVQRRRHDRTMVRTHP